MHKDRSAWSAATDASAPAQTGPPAAADPSTWPVAPGSGAEYADQNPGQLHPGQLHPGRRHPAWGHGSWGRSGWWEHPGWGHSGRSGRARSRWQDPRPERAGQAGPAPWGGSMMWIPWPVRLALGILRGVVLTLASIVSVVAPAAGRGIRQLTERRRDPVRVFERRKRLARLVVLVRGGAALAAAGIAALVGSDSGLQAGEIVWYSAAGVLGVATVPAAVRAWRLSRLAPPALPPAPVPLPPRGTPARPAMERLDERERVLADLFTHLGAGADSARTVAADAAAGLRRHAARITTVDQARRGAPPESRAALDIAVGTLTGQLDAGVAGYENLVVAAADALSASASFQAGDPVLAARLQDATDDLAGLAAGLRDVTPAS
jgi:hypothetical protein